jgi:hypothetical protein
MTYQVNRKWKIAAIVLAIIAVLQGLHAYRVNSQLKNVFYYQVVVTVKDKQTGLALDNKSVTTHFPTISTQDLFNQVATFGSSDEELIISGIAYEPREYGFSKEGYDRKNVLITNKTVSKLVVELEPIKNMAEQPAHGDAEESE